MGLHVNHKRLYRVYRAVLDRLATTIGLPHLIVLDNGPEFAGRTLDAWAFARGVTLRFIRPGKPIENAYVESFNGKFRDECLNEHWFPNLVDAKTLIEAWRVDYNTVRPHGSLAGRARRINLPGSRRELAGYCRLACKKNHNLRISPRFAIRGFGCRGQVREPT